MRRFAIIACTAVLAMTPADSETYVVRPDGGGDFPTIQAAIDATVDGDTVELTDGPFIGLGNRDIDFQGKGIAVRSQSGNPEACILQCQGAGRGLVFQSGEGSSSVLSGVGVWNGFALYGAGVCCTNGGSPLVDNCIFASNEAAWGAGLYCSEASPHFVECYFTANSATDFDRGSGGGAYCENGSNVSFVGCRFTHNEALGMNMSGGAGGGAACRECVALFDGCGFEENTARFGGGLACSWYAEASLVDCWLSGNAAGAAGGMDCSDSFVSVERCWFRDNIAGTLCGAVRCVGYEPEFSQCTFSDNRAEEGGAAGCYESSPVFTACTLSGNCAGQGGGLYCTTASFPVLDRTIIAFGGQGKSVWCDGSSGVAATCSDIYGNAGGDWVGCIAGQVGVAGNICEHPLFCGPEEDDFHLAENSPCVPYSPPNPECDLIGAWPVACGPASVPDEVPPPDGPGTRITWGGLKHTFGQ